MPHGSGPSTTPATTGCSCETLTGTMSRPSPTGTDAAQRPLPDRGRHRAGRSSGSATAATHPSPQRPFHTVEVAAARRPRPTPAASIRDHGRSRQPARRPLHHRSPQSHPESLHARTALLGRPRQQPKRLYGVGQVGHPARVTGVIPAGGSSYRRSGQRSPCIHNARASSCRR